MDKGAFGNRSLTVHLPCSRFVGTRCRIWKQHRSNSKLLRNGYGGRLKVTQKLPQKFSENFIQPYANFRRRIPVSYGGRSRAAIQASAR